MKKHYPLYDHQQKSVDFFLETNIGFDTSDPGTGKTRVQIELVAERRAKGSGCALVIAPKSLLRSAWANDFEKFAPHLKTVVATAKNREKAFDEHADVYITNTDATRWLIKQKPSFFKKFDILIIDEVADFKHRTSQRSKAAKKIAKFFRYKYGLTGTPNSNTITDIWHQIYILDNGERLGKSFSKFRASVCHPTQAGPSPNMVKWEDKPGAEQAVGTIITDITMRHKLEDCLDIPTNNMYTLPYQMSKAQIKSYKQMQDMAITQLEDGTIASAVNAAGVITKLLQIASGSTYTEDGKYTLVDTGRYELVADLVEQRPHSVVFFNWIHQRDQLITEFKKRGLTHVLIDGSVSDDNRAKAVEEYQAGFYRVLLAHPKSAAHGLTLTRGVATIWASPTYNLEHFVQANRRIYRASQTKKTETIVILADGTIESTVYKKLQAKDEKMANLLDILKEYSEDLE